MTDTKYAKPALKFDDVPKWFKDMRSSSNFMPSKMDLKPMSYNYMALVETPNRSQAYSPASVNKSQVTIGTQYHRPSDNVAKAIKSNQTVWQDIKNLGGEVKEHGGNLLGRAIDILSRPGYAIRNMYLENARRNYMTPESAGGAKMTGGEHLLAVLTMAGGINALRGQADDDIKAAWAGLSGKAKTNTAEVLKEVTPGWWAKNQNTKTGLAASIAGDILIDPLTWLTMGLSPGSVTRAGVGVGKLITFDKAGATAMFKDTIFTKTGMQQSLKTAKSDLLQSEYTKYKAMERKALRRGDKAAAKAASGKSVSKQQQYYTAKATEYADKAKNLLSEDLKGAELAARMIRKNLNPLQAMQTASRFTTGAKAGSDIWRGKAAIAVAADNVYDTIAKDMATGAGVSADGDLINSGDLWNMVYAVDKDKTFQYTHGGKTYTVDFSGATDLHSFLKRVAQEAAPVAAYAEYGPRAARSRAGRIQMAEARGRAFQDQWNQHVFENLRDGLDPGISQEQLINRLGMGKRAGLKVDLESAKKTNPEAPVVSEEAVLSGAEDYDSLMLKAREQWIEYQNSKGGKKSFGNRHAGVIIVDAEGQARRVGLNTLRNWMARQDKAMAAPVARAATAAERTTEQKAIDSLTGVSDDLAGRRDSLLKAHAAAEEERLNAAARVSNMTPEEVQHVQVLSRIERKFQSALSDSEMAQVKELLNDESIPWEQRIATLLKDEMFDDDEAIALADEIFGVDVVNGVITASRTGDPNVAMPEIFQTVLKNRISERFDDEMLKRSGHSIGVKDGNLRVTQIPSEVNPLYRNAPHDFNAEVGLALMDAWSAGLRYAADMHMLSDPKNFDAVVDNLAQQSVEFINMASADTKMQVMMLLRNTFGVAFPESFVPAFNKITESFADIDASSFKFTNATGIAPNQRIPWSNLAREIKLWTTDAVPWLKNTDDIAGQLDAAIINADKVRASAQYELYVDSEEYINGLLSKVAVLEGKVTLKDFNFTGVPEVANYSMLDYLMHTKEILAAQKTQFVRSSGPGGYVNRMTIGRLSALDSFGYVDEETRTALEALSQLKRISTQKPEGSGLFKSTLAQKALAEMFKASGGLEHMVRVDDVNRTNFVDDFKTLGSHARLKQGVVQQKANRGFGPKYAADLMEYLWETPTINHEWQKALQHKILTGVVLEGRTQTQIADDIKKSVDEFFVNHERIKELLYPVKKSKGGQTELAPSTILKRGDELQENWGTPNQVEVAQNAPTVKESAPPAPDQVVLPSGKTQFSSAEMKKHDHAPTAKKLAEIITKALQNAKATGTRVPSFLKADGSPNIDSKFIVLEGKNGYIVRNLGTAGKQYLKGTSRPPELFYVSPRGRVIKLQHTADLNDLEGINKSLGEILTTKDKTVDVRHDPRAAMSEYRPGAHVLQKDVQVAPAPEKAPTGVTPEQIQGVSELSEARWKELNAGIKADELQQQIGTLPAEATPTAEAPAPAAADVAPEPTPTAEEGLSWEQMDATDSINTGSIQYTEEERALIKEWIDNVYVGKTPEELGRVLYGHVMAMTADLAMAQARIATGLSDLKIQQYGSMRFMGIPFMAAPNPTNSTRAAAGVTALAQYRSGAHKWWSDIMDPSINPDSWISRQALKVTRESKVLEGTLFNIRRSHVNAASTARKFLIDDMNATYAQVTKGDYVTGSMAGLSKKERYMLASQNMFDTAKVTQPDSLDIFELTDGSNPVKTIEANLETFGSIAFGVEPWKNPVELGHKLTQFNNYMKKDYRLTDFELRAIQVEGIQAIPYSREWLVAVGNLLPKSRLNIKRLAEVNLADLHYNIADSSLKIESGRELYNGVWKEFATRMDADQAKVYNQQVVPATIGPDGSHMRGKLIHVGTELGPKNQWGIDPNLIPEQFKVENHYVDEMFLPHIATLFRYMQGSDKLVDVLDAGYIDKVLQYFKASVTIYKIPTYPIRNTFADVFLSAMDGLTQPKYYKRAAAVMQNAHKLSLEIDENSTTLQKIMDQNFMGEEMARAAHDPLSVADPMLGPGLTATLLHTADGEVIRLDDKQVMNLFDELGLGQNQIVGEIKESLAAARMSKPGTAAGKLHDSLRMLNDWRESWGRLSHFLYALEREAPLGGNLQDIAQRAGQRVIKHHFDYNDVSIFERNVIAPLIPFYKWVRNIVPYTLASMVTRPYMLKTEQAIQQGLGGLSDDPDDPRTDFVVPEYIRRDNPVDIGYYTDPNGNKLMQYAHINLPLSETLVGTISPTLNPLFDPSGGTIGNRLLDTGAGFMRTGVAMTNPLVKGVIQAATGRTVWPHGASDERAGESWAKTMSAAIPGVPLFDSSIKSLEAMGSDGSTGKNKAAQLLNELGVVGVLSNTEGAQVGEVKRIQDLNEGQRNKLKAELMNKLGKKYPQTTPDQRRMIVDEYVKQMRSTNG